MEQPTPLFTQLELALLCASSFSFGGSSKNARPDAVVVNIFTTTLDFRR